MKPWTQCARVVQCLVVAVALTAFGCPGDDELGLYCSLMSLAAGEDFDFDACYDYTPPDDFNEYRRYLDDVRAYQAMLAHKTISGPAAPSFNEFMTARYPDWAARAQALRASMRIPVGTTDSSLDR